jgi:hypothetical protein
MFNGYSIVYERYGGKRHLKADGKSKGLCSRGSYVKFRPTQATQVPVWCQECLKVLKVRQDKELEKQTR